MISRQEYAYGIGDEIVHNGEVLKYRDEYNGHIYMTTVDHEAGGNSPKQWYLKTN